MRGGFLEKRVMVSGQKQPFKQGINWKNIEGIPLQHFFKLRRIRKEAINRLETRLETVFKNVSVQNSEQIHFLQS